MRPLVALLIAALAACATPPAPDAAAVAQAQRVANDPVLAAQIEAAVAQGRDDRAARRARMTPAEIEAEAAPERERQARIICEARGRIAGAPYPFAGFGWGGWALSAFEQEQTARNVAQVCFDAWRATGAMPSL